MLQQVWNGYDGKYVSHESACRCWRKADILHVTCNADINKNVGSATSAHRIKVISDNIYNELCNLMVQVNVEVHPSTDTSIVPAVFHSSFVVDPKCSTKDVEDMVSTWLTLRMIWILLMPFLMKRWKILMMLAKKRISN